MCSVLNVLRQRSEFEAQQGNYNRRSFKKGVSRAALGSCEYLAQEWTAHMQASYPKLTSHYGDETLEN